MDYVLVIEASCIYVHYKIPISKYAPDRIRSCIVEKCPIIWNCASLANR